jgi:hypothetical protein
LDLLEAFCSFKDGRKQPKSQNFGNNGPDFRAIDGFIATDHREDERKMNISFI